MGRNKRKRRTSKGKSERSAMEMTFEIKPRKPKHPEVESFGIMVISATITIALKLADGTEELFEVIPDSSFRCLSVADEDEYSATSSIWQSINSESKISLCDDDTELTNLQDDILSGYLFLCAEVVKRDDKMYCKATDVFCDNEDVDIVDLIIDKLMNCYSSRYVIYNDNELYIGEWLYHKFIEILDFTELAQGLAQMEEEGLW